MGQVYLPGFTLKKKQTNWGPSNKRTGNTNPYGSMSWYIWLNLAEIDGKSRQINTMHGCYVFSNWLRLGSSLACLLLACRQVWLLSWTPREATTREEPYGGLRGAHWAHRCVAFNWATFKTLTWHSMESWLVYKEFLIWRASNEGGYHFMRPSGCRVPERTIKNRKADFYRVDKVI